MQLLDAILSIIFLIGIIISVQLNPWPTFNELHILQKENDLLKNWISDGEEDQQEFEKDFKIMFPRMNGEIEFKDKSIIIQTIPEKQYKAIVSSNGFMISNHRVEKIKISIFIS